MFREFHVGVTLREYEARNLVEVSFLRYSRKTVESVLSSKRVLVVNIFDECLLGPFVANERQCPQGGFIARRIMREDPFDRSSDSRNRSLLFWSESVNGQQRHDRGTELEQAGCDHRLGSHLLIRIVEEGNEVLPGSRVADLDESPDDVDPDILIGAQRVG